MYWFCFPKVIYTLEAAAMCFQQLFTYLLYSEGASLYSVNWLLSCKWVVLISVILIFYLDIIS